MVLITPIKFFLFKVINNLKDTNDLDEGFIEDDCMNECEQNSPDKNFEIGQIMENEDIIKLNNKENLKSEYSDKLLVKETEAHQNKKLIIYKVGYDQLLENLNKLMNAANGLLKSKNISRNKKIKSKKRIKTN